MHIKLWKELTIFQQCLYDIYFPHIITIALILIYSVKWGKNVNSFPLLKSNFIIKTFSAIPSYPKDSELHFSSVICWRFACIWYTWNIWNDRKCRKGLPWVPGKWYSQYSCLHAAADELWPLWVFSFITYLFLFCLLETINILINYKL